MRWLISELEAEEPGRAFGWLVALALTALQTGFALVLIGVVQHLRGHLDTMVRDFSTENGPLIVMLFLVTNLFCTRRAVEGIGTGHLLHRPRLGMLVNGAMWGGLNGALFLATLVPALLVAEGGVSRPHITLLLWAYAHLFIFQFYFVAFLIGWCCGLVIAAADLALIYLAGRSCRCVAAQA